MLDLDRATDQPLFRQIYGAIRERILLGRLGPGVRLPASRHLAGDLGVARTTIVLAYEQLLAEGFLQGRGSAGTFVSTLTLPRRPPRRSAPTETLPTVERKATQAVPDGAVLPRPFRIGEPALDLFPTHVWARLYARRARTSSGAFLGYGAGAGYWPLRRAIAEYSAASRGVRAAAEQVVLVRGAQQAVDVIARVLLEKGDKVWCEDPGYPLVRRLFELAGSVAVPIPVDRDGMMVDRGVARAPDARLAYVAPSHQFPVGCVMSLERRLALLAWAARAKAWIIEDDYDSEFRYPGPAIASLQGLDRADRVIYVGTFSKTVFPALRLGYLIVPPHLVDRFARTRLAVDHLAPTLEQAALADFIEEGHFTRHLRRMRSAYSERQSALLTAAERECGDMMTIEPADAGMHAIGWLSMRGADDQAISERALALGIEAPALSSYCAGIKLPPALLLGFAAIRPRTMAPALRKLRSVLAV